MRSRRSLQNSPYRDLAAVGARMLMQPLEARTLLSLGELDLFYGAGGISLPESGPNARIATVLHAVTPLPDGRAYVAGFSYMEPSLFTVVSLARLTVDGALDPTFGNGAGFVKHDISFGNDGAEDMLVQPDGKIVVLSTARQESKTWDFAVARFMPDGSPDASFGINGATLIDFGNTHDFPHALMIEPSGNLIAVGEADNGNRSMAAMARLLPSGAFDASFGSGGKVVRDGQPLGSREFFDGVVLDDGKIMLAGWAPPGQVMLARYLPNGQPDSTFGTDGVALPGGSSAGVWAITRAPGGGYYAVGGNADAYVWKYTDSGALDPSFGNGGEVLVAPYPTVSNRGEILVQGDGSILVSRSNSWGWMLARVLPQGVLDTAFGSDGTGRVTYNFGNNGDGGQGLALQPDGRALIVGGYSGVGGAVGRYLTMSVPKGAALDAASDIVSVRGDDAANTLHVSFDAGAAEVVIDIDGVTTRFPAAAATRVDVRGLGGNDTITVAPGAPPGFIDAGAGDDAVSLTRVAGARKVFGAAGNDMLTLTGGDGASGTVHFDGGAGTADTVALIGGDGDETANLAYYVPSSVFGYTVTHEGATVENMTVDGGGGADTITTTGSLRPRATIAGGSGDDDLILLPTQKGEGGFTIGYVVTVAGGDGADALHYTGSALNDSLVVGTKLSHGIRDLGFLTEIEDVFLDGLGGNDTFTVESTAVVAVHAAGGAGSDTLRFLGGAGNDQILVTPNSVTSPGRLSEISDGEAVSVAGGGGNDNIALTGGSAGVAVTVLGEAGDDTLDVNAAPWASIVFQGGTHAGSSDTLNVNAGTFTFAADARLTTLNLTVNVATGATVMFNATQRLAALNVLGGAATLAAGANRILSTRALSVENGGILDLNDNDLLLDYPASGESPLGSWNGSAYTDVAGMIASARNHTAWDGPGIRTSAAAAKEGLTTLGVGEARDLLFLSASQTALWNGVTVDATTVIVKYTYTGDLNLGGLIDAQDYGIIDNWVQFPATTGYANGDLNYDGVIDAADYGYIDNNIQVQGPPL